MERDGVDEHAAHDHDIEGSGLAPFREACVHVAGEESDSTKYIKGSVRLGQTNA